MPTVSRKVETPISYLITLAKMDVIIRFRLLLFLLITVIRFVRYGPYHNVFRVIRIAGSVPACAVYDLFRAVFIHCHRLYVQPVPCKVETPISYLIPLAEMDVVICLCLLSSLHVSVI